ncbi:uncharacterized protein LOC108664462 [Hyalella azteca]|uniref:Uncharacterized protein LOC108664462 n=1 Tax=Hyalella azteca TaxID=294128 RepID=A0A8B7MZ49_HYAAZ|nr:uncharacterized protein LOC108664462 [Hyalella azteca]
MDISGRGKTPSTFFTLCHEIWQEKELDFLLEAWLQQLQEENERLKKAGQTSSSSVCRDVVGRLYSFLTYVVRAANLPQALVYKSIDLYCRFIVKHIEVMTEYVEENAGHQSSDIKTKSSSKGKTSTRKRSLSRKEEEQQRHQKQVLLKKVIERLAEQTPLRLLSCLQLISKIDSNSKILSIAKLRAALRCLKLDYSNRAILRSETRVLETLGHRCSFPSSHLEYINLLAMCIVYRLRRSSAKQGNVDTTVKNSTTQRRRPHDGDEHEMRTKKRRCDDQRREGNREDLQFSREFKTSNKNLIKKLKNKTNSPKTSSHSKPDENTSKKQQSPSKNAPEILDDSPVPSDKFRNEDHPHGAGNLSDKVHIEPNLARLIEEDMSDVHESALTLLDASYLYRSELYAALLYKITGKTELAPKFRRAYGSVEDDRLLLCASLLFSAFQIHGGDAYTTVVGPLLATGAQLLHADIRTFSDVIISTLIEKRQ